VAPSTGAASASPVHVYTSTAAASSASNDSLPSSATWAPLGGAHSMS
jgi:hypothetical protein